MKNPHVLSLLAALGLLSGSVAQSSNPASAPAAAPPPAAANPAAPAARQPAGFPFRGKLKAVDKAAMTLTIAGKDKDRVVHLTTETKYTKAGKPATLADAVVNEEIGGYARKGEGERTEALSVRFGPPVKEPAAGSAKRKGKTTKPGAEAEADEEPMP